MSVIFGSYRLAQEYAAKLMETAHHSGFLVGRFTAAGKFAKALQQVQKSPEEKGAVEGFYKAFCAITKIVTPSFDFSPAQRAAVLRFFRLDPSVIEKVGLMEAERMGGSHEVSDLSFSRIPSYLNKQRAELQAFGPSLIQRPLAARRYMEGLQAALRNGFISKIGHGLPCERKVVEGFLGSSPEAVHVRDAEVAHALSVRMSALRELEKKISLKESVLTSPAHFAEISTSKKIMESLMIKQLSGRGLSSLSRLLALLVDVKDADEKKKVAIHVPKLNSLITALHQQGVLQVEDALEFVDLVKTLPSPLSKSASINKAADALRNEASIIEGNLNEIQKLSQDIEDAQEKRLASLQEIKSLKQKVLQERRFFALSPAEQERITQRQLTTAYESRLVGIEALDRYVNPVKLSATQRAYAVGLFAIKALSLSTFVAITGVLSYNNSQKIQEMVSSVIPYIPNNVVAFLSPYAKEVVEKVMATEKRVFDFASNLYKKGLTPLEEPVSSALWPIPATVGIFGIGMWGWSARSSAAYLLNYVRSYRVVE